MLKSQRIQKEKRMFVFIKKWSLVNVEICLIFEGFCLCCLWYWHSRTHCCPWTDYCDSVLFTVYIQACTICVSQGACLVCSILESEWQLSSIQDEQLNNKDTGVRQKPIRFAQGGLYLLSKESEVLSVLGPRFTWTVTWSCVIIKHAGKHAGIGIISMGYISETESLLTVSLLHV